MNMVFLLPATEILFDIVASHSCTATQNQLVHFVLLLTPLRFEASVESNSCITDFSKSIF